MNHWKNSTIIALGITVIMSRLLAHTDWPFTFQRPVGEVVHILDLDASLSYSANGEPLTLIPMNDGGAYSVYTVTQDGPVTVTIGGLAECEEVRVSE